MTGEIGPLQSFTVIASEPEARSVAKLMPIGEVDVGFQENQIVSLRGNDKYSTCATRCVLSIWAPVAHPSLSNDAYAEFLRSEKVLTWP